MKTGGGFLGWTPERADEVRQRLRAYLIQVTGRSGA